MNLYCFIMDSDKPRNIPENLPPLFLNFHASENIGVGRIAILTAYDFFDWWYIEMPILISKYISRINTVILDQLSIGVLLRTFFVPWHRHRSPIGYFMGIVMRLLYLPLSIFIYTLVMVSLVVLLFGWILLPIVTIIMILATPFIT